LILDKQIFIEIVKKEISLCSKSFEIS